MKLGSALAPALLWLCADTAFAQAPAGTSLPSTGGLLLRVLMSLVIVVAIIYAGYFGLRRIADRRPGASVEGPLQVLQTCSLGGDRWLYLVGIGERRIIVGGSTGQIAQIADLGSVGEIEATDEQAR